LGLIGVGNNIILVFDIDLSGPEIELEQTLEPAEYQISPSSIKVQSAWEIKGMENKKINTINLF